MTRPEFYNRCRTVYIAIFCCVAANLAGCSGGKIASVYGGASDWLNNVPEPPSPGPWRLSKQINAEKAPFPKLSEVPERPKDLPDPASSDRLVQALQEDAVRASQRNRNRPSAASLGAPPPPDVAPVSIPKYLPVPGEIVRDPRGDSR